VARKKPLQAPSTLSFEKIIIFMAGPEQRNAAYLENVRKNFAASLREVTEHLPGITELDRIRFGATYLTKSTRNDTRLRLTTLLVKPMIGETVLIDQTPTAALNTRMYLFAQDQSDKILGYRYITLADTPDTLEARGDIATAERGSGIARPLEIATKHVLSILAKKQGKSIYWKVENGNATRLHEAEQTYRDSTDIDEQAVVEGIRQEQAGWQALYGPAGKLGFDQYGVLRIDPERDYEGVNFDTIDSLNLTDWSIAAGDREVLIPFSFRPDRQLNLVPGQIRAKKLMHYLEKVRPNINRILNS
jgi:hypothetical protein